MTYSQKLQERKNAPASRITSVALNFDERLGWNSTHYALVLTPRPEEPIRLHVITARTLSMMVVER